MLQNIEEMKKRMKEIEEETGALREMQAKVEKEMGAVQGTLFFFFFLLKMHSFLFVRMLVF